MSYHKHPDEYGFRTLHLSFKATNLPSLDLFSPSDGFVVLYEKNTNNVDLLKNPVHPSNHKWVRIGHTNVVMDVASPNWSTTITIETNGIGSQEYKAEVYDADEPDLLMDMKGQDIIGTVLFTLEEFGTQNAQDPTYVGTSHFPLERDGKPVVAKDRPPARLSITIEEYARHPRKALVSMDVKCASPNDSLIQFVQIMPEDLGHSLSAAIASERELIVHQSPISTQSYPIFEINEDHLYRNNISLVQTSDSSFRQSSPSPFAIVSEDTGDDAEGKEFEIRLIKYKDSMNTKVLGKCRLPATSKSCSTKDLLGASLSFPFLNPDPKKKNDTVGTITIKSWISHNNTPSFHDFIQSGLKFQLSFAIDCSGSGSKQAAGLHNLNSDGQNQYTWALNDIGNGLIQLLGGQERIVSLQSFAFGGPATNPTAINPAERYSLSTKTETVNTIDDIVQQYKTFSKIPFPNTSSSKSKFAPFLQFYNESKVIVKEDIQQVTNWDGIKILNPIYNILVILTDGEIDDLKDTIERLSELSYKPVTVLFIGIGPDGNYIFKELMQFDTQLCGNGLLRVDKGLVVSRHMTASIPYLYYVKCLPYLSIKLQRAIQQQVVNQFFHSNKFPAKK